MHRMTCLALVIMTNVGCLANTSDAGPRTGNASGRTLSPSPASRGGTVFSADISHCGPFREIILRPKDALSNYWYDIEFRDRADRVVQRLSIRNGVPIQEKDVELVDLNADGFKDIKVLGGMDRSGASWYKTWLWNTEQEKYVWSTE